MTVWQGRRGGILACFFLLALANCGGGGGGGDSGGGGTVVADFAPQCLATNPSCYSNSVTLQKWRASGNIVEIQVVLNKLNTTIGEASLLIGFDSTVAQFICSQAGCVDGFAEGPALGTSAQGTIYEVKLTAPGELLVDVLPPAGGKSVSSAQVILTLSFKALKVGSTNLVFKSIDMRDGSALLSPAGTFIILGSLGWSGGILTGS